MDTFEVIFDILNELIVNKAFNKKTSFKKRLPYILIYYITILLLLFVTIFLSSLYIKQKNIIGYFLIFINIILFLLLFLPLFDFKNK